MVTLPNEYYRLLDTELNALFDEIAEIIYSPSDVTQIREFIDVGEYGLALETICGVIVEGGNSIPASAHQKILHLAQKMGTDKKFYEAIKIQ